MSMAKHRGIAAHNMLEEAVIVTGYAGYRLRTRYTLAYWTLLPAKTALSVLNGHVIAMSFITLKKELLSLVNTEGRSQILPRRVTAFTGRLASARRYTNRQSRASSGDDGIVERERRHMATTYGRLVTP